jgi:hypothetical protein
MSPSARPSPPDQGVQRGYPWRSHCLVEVEGGMAASAPLSWNTATSNPPFSAQNFLRNSISGVQQARAEEPRPTPTETAASFAKVAKEAFYPYRSR